MKTLHRGDLFCWSQFDQDRNIDFNSYCWVRDGGNVVIDPLPLSEHDRAHLEQLGGASWIVITNSDHTRDAVALAKQLGAKLAGPAAEKDTLGVTCDRWLADGDELVPGAAVLALDGSKTPGELAIVLEGTTLITGDLVRVHRANTLMILPDPKLKDKALAIASLTRLAALEGVEAVLVGDGYPVFEGGHLKLAALAASFAG